MSFLRILYLLLIFLNIIFFQNVVVAQTELPKKSDIPVESIVHEIEVTPTMLERNYYFRVSYSSYEAIPLWLVFYREKEENPIMSYSPEKFSLRKENIASLVDGWKSLEYPGSYLASFIILDRPYNILVNMIQSIKIVSNSRENLKNDDRTLIMDKSVGIAPRKGRNIFKIKYELNFIANIEHNVCRRKRSKEIVIFTHKENNVPKGTRGFDWMGKDMRGREVKIGEYIVNIEAESPTKSGAWDHEINYKIRKIR